MSTGTGIELQEQGLAAHFRMAGQAPTTTQIEQVFPYQRPPLEILNQVPGTIGLLVLDAQDLVVHRQQGVDQGNGVPRYQDETVGEALAGIANVPAHGPGEGVGYEHVGL